MRTAIQYGKDKISISIPDKNLLYLFDPGLQQNGDLDEEKTIEEALNNPIASEKLSALAEGKKSAAILVSDITRPAPSYKFLPNMISRLQKAGLDKIKVIFGLGIHRPHTEEEKIKLAGKTAAEKAELIDSDINRCISLGTTSKGTPIEVFEEALNNDLLIATGNIEYHYFAGYSGGAKALLPGVCSKATVTANHLMMLQEEARAGNYQNNPVSQDIRESARTVKIDFMFNVILDDQKNVIAAVSGDIIKAHLKGIELYDKIYRLEAAKKADMLITCPGGYPKDINLYQAQKALENVKEGVKPGGIVVLAAKCPEGCGEGTFEQWMRDAPDYGTLFEKISKEFVLGGHKAVAISRMLKDFRVYMASDFSKEKTESMGFGKVENLQEFIDEKIKENSNLTITLVPTGRFIKLVRA